MAKTEYISATEARTALGLSRDQMIYRCRRGDVRNKRVGRSWIIPASELTRVPTTDWYKTTKQVNDWKA
jgi:hypothetical protein